MRLRLWIPTVLVLLLAVGVVYYLDRASDGPPSAAAGSEIPLTQEAVESQSESLDALTAQSNSDLATAVLSPTAQTSPLKASLRTSFVIDSENQKLIRSCLERNTKIPRVGFTDALTLDDVLKDLTTDASLQTSQDVINVHVKKNDGKEMRLHLETSSPENKVDDQKFRVGPYDARVFDVDAEGLPIELNFPESLKSDSAKALTEKFQGVGTVMGSERRYTRELGAGLVATVVETDGRVTELQTIFSADTSAGSLACAWGDSKLSCKCF